jgi:hypothetical protein
MLTSVGTARLTTELPATLTGQIARSYERLDRSKTSLSKLDQILERSQKLIKESDKIIAGLKAPESIFKDGSER